jgi:hypothetical protein
MLGIGENTFFLKIIDFSKRSSINATQKSKL